jgi:S-adenosylmethionine:tRNA-ribosyltransferase-isomerase (queuine synthetase)
VTREDDVTLPGEGWTQVIIAPERGIRAVDGLLTGLHEPRSTHWPCSKHWLGVSNYAWLMRLHYSMVISGMNLAICTF